MKSKMWNKIFKNKSSKSSSSSSSSSVVPITETNELDDNNLFDEPQQYQQQQQQQVMIASSSTSSGFNNHNNPHNNTIGHGTKSSKLSKMVNSFTLKRNSNKENGNNCINNGYNNEVAVSIIRNAELNNEISKFNNNYNKTSTLNKNIKNIKRQNSNDTNDSDDDDDLIPIMDTTSKLIKTTPPDEIPLSPKSDFNESNFPISPEPTHQIDLQTCPICTRKFVPETLEKHVGICERMASKKRKKFDSFRQRREGTDLADYLPKNFGLPTTTVSQPSKQQTVIEPKILSPKIQIKEGTPLAPHKQIETTSQHLQNSQRKGTLNPISPTSKPIRSKNVVKRLAPVSEQCPHCGRSFGIKAFDRHVDWCKEKSRLQAMKNNADLKTAKDRLEARTKYRAPNLKAKREAIRYKYSGNGDDRHSVDDNRSVDNNIFSMSNSLSSSFMSDGPTDEKLISEKSGLSIKAQKINTDKISLAEATINLKTVDKSFKKAKPPNINTKIKKKPIPKPKTNKKKSVKELDENIEDSSIVKEELNLIGLSENCNNESPSHDFSDDFNFENDENICNITMPVSINTEKKSQDYNENLPIVDRIEIEEIIPLNSKNQFKFDFDDTPMPPTTKSVVVKNPTNNFDETPIRPSKSILNDMITLNLPTMCNTKSENSKDYLPICSPKIIVTEETLNESEQNISEPTESIVEDISENSFEEMPIQSSKTQLLEKPLVFSKISTKKIDISKNESVENLFGQPESMQEDFHQMLPKLNLDIIMRQEETDTNYKQSPVLPRICTTETGDLESNSTITSAICTAEEEPLNEFLENLNEVSTINVKSKAKVNSDEIPIKRVQIKQFGKNKSTKSTSVVSTRPLHSKMKDRPNDCVKEVIVRANSSNKLNLSQRAISPQYTPIQSPNVIFKNRNLSQLDEIEIRTPKQLLKNTRSNGIDHFSVQSPKTIVRDIQKNNVNERFQPKTTRNIKSINNTDEVSIRQLKTNVRKVTVDQTNSRERSINKVPFNLPIISNQSTEFKNTFTENNKDYFDEVATRKSKPLLRNTINKSANDIPINLSKNILKTKYANNFNEISSLSTKKNVETEIRPTRKLSLKTILPPINGPSLSSISSDDFDKLLSSSDQINCGRDSQTSFELLKKTKKGDDKIYLPKVSSRNSNKTSLTNDGLDNFWLQISNDTKSRTGTNSTKQNLNEENFNKKSGFSDKYDPFLSAKRQLEELCSPTAEAESPFSTKQHHQPAPNTSTPITVKPKLTASLSTSYTTPSPNPQNTLNTVKSNFRRTSSLRSPRKTNPCPRPLFVPLSRCSRPTTIQRGISDEGPISTNFIRPEEYDEMPVKSACINNFATAINSPQFSRRDSSPQKLLSRSSSRESSPLVIKRDPLSNLNRRNLRLNLGNNKELNNISSNNIPLLKTDSLAVFLKYETELTKNPSDKLISSLNQLGNTQPQENSSSTTPLVSNIISEKDWKDKSNTLSKQNSLKNSSSDLVEKTFGNVEKEKLTLLKNSLTNLLDSGNNNNIVNNISKKLPPTITSPPDVNISMTVVNKSLPIKLEPLHQKVYINTVTPPPSKSQSPPVVTPSLAPLFPKIKSTPMTVAINNNLINLNSILNIDSKEMDSNHFIDPKLINICDNLQVTTTNTTSTKQTDESDLTSFGSQDSAYRPKTIPIQLSDDYDSSGHQSSESVIEKSPSPPTAQRKEQYQRQTSSNRNSTDKKNLLKRQIRLGKNQFLYDASPSDSEPSPDPILHKSQDDLLTSVMPITNHLPSVESSEKEFDSLLSPSNNPIFNDFDFEEFLSSFETSNDDDDDQFPGFKDCKEFLMNRCLNMRSMNNNFINNSNIFNNTQNSIRSRKIELDPMMMLNDSSTNNNNKRQSSHDDDDDVQIVHDEREIFISIETDQNENETLNPCPNDPSIQNPKIEEINGNDNKFTKIETYHLPIFEEKDENLTTDFINDVTIRRNNVKNKQQHEDIKENITCDSVTSMYPVDSDERSSVECYPIGRRSVKSKTSADSAYGSLSRQSPILTDRSSLRRNSASRNNHRLPNEQNTQLSDANVVIQSNDTKRRNRELSASSSGSENSLPPINSHHHHQQQKNLGLYEEESNLQHSKDTFSTATMDFGNLPSPGGQHSQQQQHQMSKFCHECGSRFLVTQAKFCMECGVKRIILK